MFIFLQYYFRVSFSKIGVCKSSLFLSATAVGLPTLFSIFRWKNYNDEVYNQTLAGSEKNLFNLKPKTTFDLANQSDCFLSYVIF
jgi:hypothetical protein